MEQIKPDTPLVYLTVEQFTSLLQKLLPTQEPVKESLPEYFGIDTFCEVTGYKNVKVYNISMLRIFSTKIFKKTGYDTI